MTLHLAGVNEFLVRIRRDAGTQSTDDLLASFKIPPDVSVAVQEGKNYLDLALRKFGLSALCGEGSGWLALVNGHGPDHSTQHTAKDLRRFRNRLITVHTELARRIAELRPRYRAIDQFMVESNSTHPHTCPVTITISEESSADEGEEEGRLSFLTVQERRRHAIAASSSGGGGGNRSGQNSELSGIGILPPELVEGLVCLRALHADTLSELRGLRFAISR